MHACMHARTHAAGVIKVETGLVDLERWEERKKPDRYIFRETGSGGGGGGCRPSEKYPTNQPFIGVYFTFHSAYV